MKVSQLMHTPAIVCGPNATLRDVAHLMDERNVGSVIVVDNVGYVAGIVTDRDIALRGVGRGHSPDTTVDNIMSRDVAAVGPGSDIVEVAAVMQKRSVRRVPVVDEMGKVHGVVAMDDLFRNLSHEADALVDATLYQALRAR